MCPACLKALLMFRWASAWLHTHTHTHTLTLHLAGRLYNLTPVSSGCGCGGHLTENDRNNSWTKSQSAVCNSGTHTHTHTRSSESQTRVWTGMTAAATHALSAGQRDSTSVEEFTEFTVLWGVTLCAVSCLRSVAFIIDFRFLKIRSACLTNPVSLLSSTGDSKHTVWHLSACVWQCQGVCCRVVTYWPKSQEPTQVSMTFWLGSLLQM